MSSSKNRLRGSYGFPEKSHLLGHGGANGVESEIVPVGPAKSVPEPSGDRIDRTQLQLLTENVQLRRSPGTNPTSACKLVKRHNYKHRYIKYNHLSAKMEAILI